MKTFLAWTGRILLVPVLACALEGTGNATGCTSASGCADCENAANGIASCITVQRDAHCECSIRVTTPTMCILEDICDYTATGGGAGGGGGGGGGGTCSRPPGAWCPSECSSCETIYWY